MIAEDEPATVTVRLRDGKGGVLRVLEMPAPALCDVQTELFVLRARAIHTRVQATTNRVDRALAELDAEDASSRSTG